MYTSLIAVCLLGSAFADPFYNAGFGFPSWTQGQQGAQQQQASQGQGAAAQGAARGAQAAGASSAAQMSQNAAQAARVEASGANREEAAAGMRRRQSVLLAADHEEGAGFEGQASSAGSAGAGDSGAVMGYCNGIPMTGSQHLCCDGQYYGNTWSELSCCGNSIYDGRFYGCKNNVLAPLYRPIYSQPSEFAGGVRPTRLCGNYVWQMYNAPYELCCDGVHYPNPFGHYGCCGARAYDSRYYNCGRDEVKQRWYVFKRSTFVLAATEEIEAVGSRSQSGVGRFAAEEGAVASAQASASQQEAARAQGAQQGAQGARAGAQGSAAQGGQAGAAFNSPYSPYFGLWGYGNGAAGQGAGAVPGFGKK